MYTNVVKAMYSINGITKNSMYDVLKENEFSYVIKLEDSIVCLDKKIFKRV